MDYCVRIFATIALGAVLAAPSVQAGDVAPTITVGTQEVGLTAGYMFSHRLTELHTTKQHGPAVMPS
ncbi:MAG: hypothetical protein HC794_03420 [Nitrospiraceae bacterium]|nr:hypothetical protein [Nitrospiraceae bacterium]